VQTSAPHEHPEPPDIEETIARALPLEPEPSVWARAGRISLRVLPFILLAAAVLVLRHEFRHLSWSSVARAMDGWGDLAIFLALVLTVLSFLLMGVVEYVGLRWAGARLPWSVAIAGSFLSGAIAHAIGANVLVSGAIRARLYDRYKVSITQVAGTTLFAAISFGVGLAALSGGGLLLASTAELDATAIPVNLARLMGVLFLAGALGYVALCALRRRPICIFERNVHLPSGMDAVWQLVLGVVDNGIAAGIIWILLPAGASSYFSFVGAYAVACIAGLVSTVPGGAGVFEGAISTLLPKVSAAPLAAAFLGYRLAYYVLPLIIASLALAGDTLLRSRGR
jgi:uncharacterized membrane protein YbhN (UPF0104 family)